MLQFKNRQARIKERGAVEKARHMTISLKEVMMKRKKREKLLMQIKSLQLNSDHPCNRLDPQWTWECKQPVEDVECHNLDLQVQLVATDRHYQDQLLILTLPLNRAVK